MGVSTYEYSTDGVANRPPFLARTFGKQKQMIPAESISMQSVPAVSSNWYAEKGMPPLESNGDVVPVPSQLSLQPLESILPTENPIEAIPENPSTVESAPPSQKVIRKAVPK